MKFYQKLIGLTTTGAEKIIEFDSAGFKFSGQNLLDIKDVLPKTNEQGNIGASLNKFLNLYVKNIWTNSVGGINDNWLINYSNGALSFANQGDLLFSSNSSQIKFEDGIIWASQNSINLGKTETPFANGYFTNGYFTNGYFTNIGSSSSKIVDAFFTTIDTVNVKINGNTIRKNTTVSQAEVMSSGIPVYWNQAVTAPASCVFVGIWTLTLGFGATTETIRIPLNIYNTGAQYIMNSHSFISGGLPHYILFEIQNNQGAVSIKGQADEIWVGLYNGSVSKNGRAKASQITGFLL